MTFEWDEAKNRRNIEKHGISFEEAQEIFKDPCVLTSLDDRFEYGEVRKITVGEIPLTTLKTTIVVVVVHTDRDGITRIISARKASRKERKNYEERKVLS